VPSRQYLDTSVRFVCGLVNKMPKGIRTRGSLTTGYHRGTYKWLVGDVKSLKRDEVVWSKVFEMGGFKWMLALFRGIRNGNPPEMIRIFLFSCNGGGVYSDVSFMILSGEQAICPDSERKPKMALPFQYIDKRDVLVKRLQNQSPQPKQWEFVVTVDLKNIRAATEDELRKLRCHTRTVQVEVICAESIKKALNRSGSSRIIMPDRHRNCDVSGASLIGLWAKRDPDHRYWLCERSMNGKLVVSRCLNSARLFERFEDVCDKSGGGFPWVTVFREDKKSDEEFQPIDDAIMVLCLLNDAGYSDLSYLGHRVIQQTVSGLELSTVISRMAGMQEGCTYRVFAEGSLLAFDITSKLCSLKTCGVCSGCCMILRNPATTPRLGLESNQQPISEIQESDQNDENRACVHSSSQSSDQQSSGGGSDTSEDSAEVAKKSKVDTVKVGLGENRTICFVFAFFLILASAWVLSQNVGGLLERAQKNLKWQRKQQ